MNYLYCLVLVFNVLLSGCHGLQRSEIEIIKYDPKQVQEITTRFDSTYIEYPKRSDFWTINHYLVNPDGENTIMRDSLGNIVAVVKRNKGVVYFSQEYYPNGQLKGKTEFQTPGVITGPATYYFKDGRIRMRGQWNDFKRVGEWKNYDDSGYLESVRHFSSEGLLEKEIKTSN